MTGNGDKDPDYRLLVNGGTILSGLAKVISTLFLEAVGPTFTCAPQQTSPSRPDGDAAPRGVECLQLSRVWINILADEPNAGHTHGISLYTGTAGDPPHEHLVEGATGIEQ